jgi:hypothetical protein
VGAPSITPKNAGAYANVSSKPDKKKKVEAADGPPE